MFSSLKLISGAVILAVLLGASWYIHHLYKESKRVPALISTINVMQQNEKRNNEASQGYQDEIARLRNKPARIVRLCKPSESVRVHDDASGSHGASPGGGELPQSPGPDIGQDLYSEADRADQLAAQLRAIQERLSHQ